MTEIERQEEQRIAEMASHLDETQRQELGRQARELLRLQQTPDSPEDLARLPRLTLQDLPPKNTIIPCEEGTVAGATTLLHDIPTNGLVYLDLCFDLRPMLQQRPGLAPLTSLFSRALLEMGTRKRDYVELSTRIARKTGGLEAEPFASARHCSSQAVARLLLRGKATLVKAGDLADILEEVLCEADFSDAERLRQLVQEELAGLEQRIAPMGHRMALSRVTARQSESGMLNECFHGVNQLTFLRRLAKVTAQSPQTVQKALDDFRRLVLHQSGLVLNITTPQSAVQGLQPVLEQLVSSLTHKPGDTDDRSLETLLGADFALPDAGAFALTSPKEGLQFSSRVNYVAKGANLYHNNYVFHGAALAGVRLLSTGWLWDKIRVQGGAYGAFCHLDRLSGALAMASYRDPNLSATLQAFDDASRALSEASKDREALESAIIGTVGDLDEHLLPDAKGFASLIRWLAEDSEETRQIMREEILSATAADMDPFIEGLRYFAEQGVICALGPGQALAEAAGEDWRLSRLL